MKFYTTTEAAEVFSKQSENDEQISPETVKWWCRNGHIKAQKVGGNWIIVECDLIRPSLKRGAPIKHGNRSKFKGVDDGN